MASTSTAPIVALMASASTSTLIKQGAEAKVYVTTMFPEPTRTATHRHDVGTASTSSSSKVILKHRFEKTYRHPSLSAQLTAARTTAEARALVRCARSGVNTPRVVGVDEENGVLCMEVIDGHSVRELLGGGSEGDEAGSDEAPAEPSSATLLNPDEAMSVMQRVGVQLARMHQAHIIHGDLTTSNMMIRQKGSGSAVGDVVLIDFGLSSNSTMAEDKAVDLYVLERAFASTHPRSEHLFREILRSYQDTLERHPLIATDPKSKAEKGMAGGPTQWRDIKRKLDDVRLRGRKRSMVG